MDRAFGFASNPEFLREGYCWENFIEPDRLVVGVQDEKSAAVIQKLYQPFGAPVHLISYNSAEFIKYLSNTIDLGSGTVTSTREIAEMTVRMLNPDITPEFGALEDRPLEQESKTNIEETYQKVGWKAETGFAQGLKKRSNPLGTNSERNTKTYLGIPLN